MNRRLFTMVATALFITSAPAIAAESSPELHAALKLADLSIEELMQYEITSVSKEPEPLFKAASSIYVITGEEIRRSGVTSLPEALRLAPGVQVSRIDGSKWAIGIRGFAGRFSNKLLVLQDGRTLYNSTFSGVYWNAQETMLEDVDRIEVIRGQGATLWGSNAVNGVINIITKSSKDTAGGIITATGGSWERASTAVRYGVKSGDDGAFRAYGKYFYRDTMKPVTGNDYEGYSNDWRTGFRGDWDLKTAGELTVQGDAFDSRSGSAIYSGSNILGRWSKKLSQTADISLQLYYDHSENRKRVETNQNSYFEKTDIFDVEFQHSFSPCRRQNIVWGTGIRLLHDSLPGTTGAYNPVFTPPSTDKHLYSMFISDTIQIVDDTLSLSFGARSEHHEDTGWSVQPTARISYTPDSNNTLWTSVSRGVRTPSRAENLISALVDFIPPSTEVRIVGSSAVKPEVVVSYEAGYRVAPRSDLFFDTVLFFNDYSRIIGMDAGTPVSPYLMPLIIQPTTKGHSKGYELVVNWRPEGFGRYEMNYSYIASDFSTTSSIATADVNMTYSATAPRHQFGLRGGFDISKSISFDAWLRYIDEISKLSVKDYFTADLRLAWRPFKQFEISLVGQNLIDSYHVEYGSDLFGNSPAKIPRSVYGKVKWEF